jgi:hypothetical protein
MRQFFSGAWESRLTFDSQLGPLSRGDRLKSSIYEVMFGSFLEARSSNRLQLPVRQDSRLEPGLIMAHEPVVGRQVGTFESANLAGPLVCAASTSLIGSDLHNQGLDGTARQRAIGRGTKVKLFTGSMAESATNSRGWNGDDWE